MIINNLTIEENGLYIRVCVDCKIRWGGSDRVYFKLDKKFKDSICTDYSPFLVSFLVPAMSLGENIYIEGEVSKEVYDSLDRIQNKFVSWNIGLKKINVYVNGLNSEKYNVKKRAVFFSGGVDSFYTYLKNKEDGIVLDYFILANGYDINIRNKSLWDSTSEYIENISKIEKVDLIKVESNIRDIIEPIVMWDYSHGGCLAALGLLLTKELSDVYIGSTYTFKQMFPWGSHPEVDSLWSSESTKFHHHGADTTRLEKVFYISKYPIVLKTLRVCYLNKKDNFNCGVCDKCMRTMINLELAGKLLNSETFPKKVDINLLKKIKIESSHGAIFHEENLEYMKVNDLRKDIQETLVTLLSDVKDGQNIIEKILRKIMFLDFYYLRGVLYSILNLYRYN